MIVDLAVITEPFGRIGTLNALNQVQTAQTVIDGIRVGWTGAVGLATTERVQVRPPVPGNDDGALLAAIIATDKQADVTTLTEYYGVVFFKPLEGLRLDEQLRGFKQRPSMFEMVHPMTLRPKSNYVFYARRTTTSTGRERRKL